MSRPVVANYCTTFLKKEMRHIYRQVAGLNHFTTFVMTKSRENAEIFPFEDVVVLPRPRINFLSRFYQKYVTRREPVFYRGEYDQLAGVLADRQADLMHVYFGHTGVHLLPFIRNWPKPSVVSFHGMDVMLRHDEPGYNRRLAELLKAVPMVMARSESLAERLVELGCPAEKIRINRTGIPMDAFPCVEREVPSDGAWKFVQACRLIPKKGLPDTLEAFAIFCAHHPSATLLLAGEGPEEKALRQQADRLGLSHAVQFAGFLETKELAAVYRKSHIFIHPSATTQAGDREGVPNSMLEAMATGLPVVATTHGGIPEAVTNGVDGILVPENDPQALGQALLSLAENPRQWREMGASAARNVRAKFEAGTSIASLEAHYEELLRRH